MDILLAILALLVIAGTAAIISATDLPIWPRLAVSLAGGIAVFIIALIAYLQLRHRS